jgi:hypothetical protein
MSQVNGDYNSQLIDDGDTLTQDDQLLVFNRLCAQAFPPRNKSEEAKYQSHMSWEPVRDWLQTHSLEEVRQAAEQHGDSGMTALHFACRNGSVLDVIEAILSVAIETAQWPDSFGWLPIHYACACGADTAVIKRLSEEFPESKTTVDRRGRTPLHFALGNQNPDRMATPQVVAILSSTGAASVADEHGMLVSNSANEEGRLHSRFNFCHYVFLLNCSLFITHVHMVRQRRHFTS